MKIFYKKSSNYLFLITKKFTLKIPTTLNSYKNLLQNQLNISCAKNDIFYKNFIPKTYLFLIFEYSKTYEESCLNQKSIFIKKLKKIFLSKPKRKIKLINFEFYRYFLKIPFKQSFKNKLNKNFFNRSIELSSCHGDFYYKNILKLKNEFKLIDWNKFEKNSSAYFDFINYDIFSKEFYNGNWYKVWKNRYNVLLNNYPKLYVDLYVIWKISSEARTQKNSSRLLNKINRILNDYTKYLTNSK